MTPSIAKVTSLSALWLVGAMTSLAVAPDFVGDSLYRETLGLASIRLDEEHSVKLLPDGTYRENWVRKGSTITRSVYGYPSDYGTPVNGTYTYTKTSDTTASLTFFPAGALTSLPRTLIFTSGTAGNLYSGGESGSFTLAGPRSIPQPLVVASARVRVHPGEPSIVGFVVGRDGDFLIRVIGPTLKRFGLTSPWANPTYELYNSPNRLQPWGPFAGDPLGIRKPPTWDWNDSYRIMHLQAFAVTGSFDLDDGSKDIATVVPLAPGVYTIVLLPEANDPGGDTLVEVTEIP